MNRISLSSTLGALATFFILLLCCSLSQGGLYVRNIALFLDLEPLILLIFTVSGLLLFSYGADGCKFILECPALIFLKPREPSPVKAEIARSAAIYSVAGGILGTLIGTIRMFAFLDDPSKIGSGLAVALISALYGTMAAGFVFIPISRKFGVQRQEPQTNATSSWKLFGGCIASLTGIAFIFFALCILVGIFGVKIAPHDDDLLAKTCKTLDGRTEFVIKSFQAILKRDPAKGEIKYLKVDAVIESSGKAAEKFFNGATVNRIKSLMVTESMATPDEEATTVEGKAKLEKRILDALRAMAPADVKIDAFYFSYYLVS